MKFEDYTEVLNRIEQEGVGYFLLHYTRADSMPTAFGEALFRKAEEAIRELMEYVEAQSDKEQSEF